MLRGELGGGSACWRFEESIELGDEGLDFLADDLPQSVVIDPVVAVDEAISHRDDLRPGDVRGARARRFGDSSRGFADDLDEFDQREEEDAVAVEVVAGLAFADRERFEGMIAHVPNGNRVVMPRHRSALLRGAPVH